MPKSLKSTKQALIAAVEGGGTSFIVTIALVKPKSRTWNNLTIPHTRFEILHQETIITTSPSDTLASTSHFFSKHRPENGYDALGICTFGPVGVNPNDDHRNDHDDDDVNDDDDDGDETAGPSSSNTSTRNYGRILSGSPKKDWRNVDILSPILKACSSIDGKHVPLYKVETDVNAPAMAEYEYTRKILHKDISSLAYVTVGTGIGVGLVMNGRPVHGMMHPEGGHVPIVPIRMGTSTSAEENDFAYSWGDNSPFKGRNAVEGTASSVALSERMALLHRKDSTNSTAEGDYQSREGLKDLGDDDPIWDHAANALANLCVTLALVTSVEKIVLGGGIMNREILFDKIRNRTRELLNGYLDLPQVTTDEGLKEYIGPSVWKEHGAGLVGALVLAQLALEENDNGMALENSSNKCSSASKCKVTSYPMSAVALYGGILALGVLIGSRHKK